MENLRVMITLFVIVVLGYVLAKLRYMSADFCRQLSAIVVDVTCPLLILSSVMGDTLPSRALILPLVGVGVLSYVILTAVAYIVPRAFTKSPADRGVIGFALMFANVGFIGYPIVASIFGSTTVFYAALLNMANTFFIFTVGVDLVKGHDNDGQKHRFNAKVLLSPGLLAAYAEISGVGRWTAHGLGQVQRGGQHRFRNKDARMAQVLFHRRASHHYACHPRYGLCAEILVIGCESPV